MDGEEMIAALKKRPSMSDQLAMPDGSGGGGKPPNGGASMGGRSLLGEKAGDQERARHEREKAEGNIARIRIFSRADSHLADRVKAARDLAGILTRQRELLSGFDGWKEDALHAIGNLAPLCGDSSLRGPVDAAAEAFGKAAGEPIGKPKAPDHPDGWPQPRNIRDRLHWEIYHYDSREAHEKNGLPTARKEAEYLQPAREEAKAIGIVPVGKGISSAALMDDDHMRAAWGMAAGRGKGSRV